MKRLTTVLLSSLLLFLVGCGSKNTKTQETMSNISQPAIDKIVKELTEMYPEQSSRIERSIPQAAALWQTADGTEDDFAAFCREQFVADEQDLENLANTLQRNLEILWGNYNKMSVDMKLPLHVVGPDITPLDEIFGSFDPYAHLTDDLFANKVAFIAIINFPFYSLDEKNELGASWNRRQWAYARLGDVFTARIPAEYNQNISNALTSADSYISAYNIIMGNLLNDNNQTLFPADMKLISHWGLRDELKSNYANKENGLEKQRMIYTVMKHIVNQTIPECVVNNEEYQWNPGQNKVYKDGKEVSYTSEPMTRYQYFLANFKAEQAIDKYTPTYPTCIERSFNESMELSFDEIEAMFTEFIASEQVKDVAALISQRLGRDLEPFDIWYDGFKSRGTVSEDELSAKTRALYPNRDAVSKDLPRILAKLGFDKNKAADICRYITVDPSRGAGHAWEAAMKTDNARLRTRIADNGMDYKGYNIAVHEFGHNVEQTVTLHDVDNYIMKGVPSTAFTEALAFVFQKRDLELLGYTNSDPDKEYMKTLDIFWGCYEIMGVSLVDMYVWKWLYQNPDATAEELKNQVVATAKEVWNKYYAPILGETDSPILGIYSHMIDAPLYLPNYPFGHIVEFQLEQLFAGKNIAEEIMRIYPVGRLTPQQWMINATGEKVSTKPLLIATQEAVAKIK
ncbi:MAG: hypothetical protein IKJ67_04525 [Bacteroidales bacterium]|nr:hypothetical protein [Bacteroidales bacterium]